MFMHVAALPFALPIVHCSIEKLIADPFTLFFFSDSSANLASARPPVSRSQSQTASRSAANIQSHGKKGSGSSNTSDRYLSSQQKKTAKHSPSNSREEATPLHSGQQQASFDWRSGRPMAGMLDYERARTRRDRTYVGSECAVCEEPLEHTLRGEKILQFSCSHVSHEACFYEFIKEFESQYCPTCNAPLSLDTSRGANVLDLGKPTAYWTMQSDFKLNFPQKN